MKKLIMLVMLLTFSMGTFCKTQVTIIRKNGNIVKFWAEGHSGYGYNGEDIVCAAISTSSQQTLFGILYYLEIPCYIGQDDETGMLYLDLEKNTGNLSKKEYQKLIEKNRESLNVLLETMVIMLKEIENAYSENLIVVEKDEKI